MKETYGLKADSSVIAVDWAQQLILKSLVFFQGGDLGVKVFWCFLAENIVQKCPKVACIWGIIMGCVMINGYLEKCLLIFSVGL